MATKKTVKTGKLPKITVSEKKKVIFVGSEAAPFIATGGLADVLGSLPKALAKRGNVEASVIIPLYGNISSEYRKNFEFITNFNVSVGWRWQYAGVFKYNFNGVNFYFIDNEYYFKREGNIYGFYDDGERFAFFSRAALDLIAWLNIYPDVLHCNDWHTAASIIYLKGMYYGDEKFRRIKTVFSIHNIEYQGVFGMDTYADLFGFPDSLKQFVEFDGAVNLMKGAIEMTDVVSTVSPTYAEEIKNSYYAHGLENIINRNAYKLCGILNGIDTDYYNPETDKFLFANYSVNDLSGKKICKAELQKMLGLPVREDVPMIAIISRLVSHKGIDLVTGVIESLLSQTESLLAGCDCEDACYKCLKHYRNQYVHGLLDRHAALDLLRWGKTGERAKKLSFKTQEKLLNPLTIILKQMGCILVFENNSIFVKKGNKEKKVIVYPAMWVEPIERETIFISDAYLKYAKPYALQKIVESL